jgi:hypothetical protein
MSIIVRQRRSRAAHAWGIDFDAVPKDLDRVIDAALDRGAEVLWEDAGHRAPMQVTADGVQRLKACPCPCKRRPTGWTPTTTFCF